MKISIYVLTLTFFVFLNTFIQSTLITVIDHLSTLCSINWRSQPYFVTLYINKLQNEKKLLSLIDFF